ncbi:MAG TPA: HAMP domain-containing protein [Persephonella sp.]|uniref:histidine kinase n=1 Tax=Persephonella marina (strain DSM 14350 / EX-H1) TaxID=123214 RepID=C0QS49_PERMH|nr:MULTISPECIES: HAMP domain-containing protein [Persephonella]ACO03382.1 phototaxis transducer II [Persephonella marina EX-H1]HCB69239.1 HAMP domain-containing protein [Persephonella sp.]
MTEKRSSVLNQISVIILLGSFFGAFFVGFLVYLLISEHDKEGALKKAFFSYIITQAVFLVLVYIIRLSIDKTIISKIKSITRAMDEVSLGNLDVEVKASGNDELTDLAESFERMRISMKTIIEKLER